MRFFLSGFVLSILLFLSCNQNEIKSDMIKFDQAFIPLSHFVRQGELHKAGEVLPALNLQWKSIAQRYGEKEDSDDWQETFRRIDNWFYSLYQAIDQKEQAWAMAQVEHIRYELIDFRNRNNISYYLDQVFEFQVALDIVNERAQDHVLCWHTWDEFVEQVNEAKQAWAKGQTP